MKQKIYTFGLISAIILASGAMFKLNHWPAASIMLTLGTFLLLFLFLPAALINHFKAHGNIQNRLLYIVTYLTCFVLFTAMLFKIQHWPFAGYLIYISVPFPFVVFLPVWLYVTSKIKNFDINNTIFILFLLALQAVFSALLTLNVSKDKIYTSLELSKNLYSLNFNIEKYASGSAESSVAISADEVLKNIEVCRQLISDKTGITREGLQNETIDNRYIDSRNIAQELLVNTESPSPAMNLEESIRKFISEIENIPGYQDVAKQTASLLFFNTEREDGPSWSDLIFSDIYLAWNIVDLDAMENVVRVIKNGVLN